MASSPRDIVTWAQVGDLHADEADGFAGVERLRAIVDDLNGLGDAIAFVFVPGDNANHGTPAQYRRVVDALDRLTMPWRMIPGDHDVESGDLDAFRAAVPPANRPGVEVIAGHRCIFLDIVSAGRGGPDFRLTMHDCLRLVEELTRAAADGAPPIVFMHAYPGDLADGETVARTIADGGVAFVGTGHTHYNELLNDGRVVYGATRSTAQIEEGAPGYTISTLCDGVVSWHFREPGDAAPMVRIVSPADLRLMTRPADPRHVPRPGAVAVVAQRLGASDDPMLLSADGDAAIAMTPEGALWSGTLMLEAGLHRLTLRCGATQDVIEVLVRAADALPKRPAPVALGHAVHALGAWPERGIFGTRLGPNRNGGAS